ncbi:MAG TPA: segregation/condensation protein A [Polyangiaceae bacterium LLY-WYZ-15_(1-7)]|nr:hypothetical protein [Sandaracinus sp.]HJL06272.1 segregation/condensation protein A [Polyangiaceae bacterium LLY-WYZ-15_(1-7)]HJL10833.1 segregation/condensation protein A [Polyangiaceae bacterium LLY-WYZ-15_(1-7)]HJL26714.1 segregation/condensation protein A [Polyangiaceae bacterium LLY-WYZ-15_(1-7)]HJL32325.1 segregation/condensation protein A [Polyangiaceae bacterium LLY-WYZ-15_(1-7)]
MASETPETGDASPEEPEATASAARAADEPEGGGSEEATSATGTAEEPAAGASEAGEESAGEASEETTAAREAKDLAEEWPDAPTPLDPDFRIALPNFEGPLDLLLYLIKKHELDILDLPIAFVTEKYVEYISLMEQLNLDIASEYLVMAATLAHIKSKSLLPTVPSDQDDDELEDEIDPRQELIRRLLEYQKYRRAAEQLGSRGVAGRDVFPRGLPAPKAEGPAPLAEFSVFKLIDAFQKIVKRKQGDLSLEIDAERITIQERIGQITESLKRHERVGFVSLFDGYATTYDLVVTFLALLEMGKMRLIRIYQSGKDDEIYLEYRVLDAEAPDEPEPPPQDASAAPPPDPEAAAQARTQTEAGIEAPGHEVPDVEPEPEPVEPPADWAAAAAAEAAAAFDTHDTEAGAEAAEAVGWGDADDEELEEELEAEAEAARDEEPPWAPVEAAEGQGAAGETSAEAVPADSAGERAAGERPADAAPVDGAPVDEPADAGNPAGIDDETGIGSETATDEPGFAGAPGPFAPESVAEDGEGAGPDGRSVGEPLENGEETEQDGSP